MRDGVTFTLKELRGVYVKQKDKVYEVDCMGCLTYVPGVMESINNHTWAIDETNEPGKCLIGYRTPSEVKKG